MERIAIQGDSPAARFLMLAIAHTGKHHLLRGKVLVNVQLTIDGEEVPVVAALEAITARLEQQVEEAAQERAVKLVTDAGLADVLNSLTTARVALRRAFATVRERYPDDAPHVEPV